MERDRAWGLLAGVPVAVLATIDPEGLPHLVPFTFAVLEPDRLVSAVDDKPKATRRLRRLDNIRRDPRVTVLAHHYDDDWSQLWWVRAEGQAEVTENAPAGAESSLVDRYPHYEDQRLGPWLVIAVVELSGWSAT